MKKIIYLLFFFLICFTSISYSQLGNLETELFSSGHSQVLAMRELPDNTFIIIEKAGNIKHLDTDGSTLTTLINIDDQIGDDGGERGLLGLAVHPDFSNNGYIYVNHTDNSNDTRIARYTVVDAGGGKTINSSSREEIFDFDQPFSNHNGGDIHFGPDGYLYIASGDGGSGGDPQNNAQDLMSPLGKIHRLDVDNGDPYAIPGDNPFLGDPNAMDEIWSYGLRNPWRISFDRENGDMWIADVGQNLYEEVNRENANTSGGLNYGWRCYEGNEIYNDDPPCTGELEFPYYVYGRDQGCSVTGGYRHRDDGSGSENFDLYIYSDFCTSDLFTLVPHPILEDEPLTEYIFNRFGAVSFAEEINGDLYAMGLGSGEIQKIDITCNFSYTPTVTYSSTTVCETNDSITIDVDNPNDTYAVLLKDGEAVEVSEDGEFVIYDGGTYEVYVQGVCRTDLSSETEITVLDCQCTDPPVAMAGDDFSICNEAGNTASLNGSVSNTPNSIWTTSGTGSFDDPAEAVTFYTPSQDDLDNGSVTLTLTAEDPDGNGPCEADSDELILSFDFQPQIANYSDISICFSYELPPLMGDLSPNAGYYDGPGGTGNQFSPGDEITETTLIYVFDEINGCSDEEDFVVVINSLTVDAGDDQTIPSGTTANLDATVSDGSGNYEYFWTPIDKVQNDQIEDPETEILNSTTEFTLEVIDNNTNCVQTDNVTINVDGQPLSVISEADPEVICENESTTISATASGGSGNYSYEWTSIPSGYNSTNATNNVSPDETTSYIVEVNDGFTTVSDTVLVEVDPLASVEVGQDSEICQNDLIVELMAEIENANSGTWTSSGTGIIEDENALMTIYQISEEDRDLNSITFTFTTDSDSECPQAEDSFTVTIDDISVDAGDAQSIPVGTSTELTAEVMNGSGIYEYSWTPEDKVVSPDQAITQTEALEETTIFTISVTDSEDGCIASDDVTITITGSELNVNIQADKDEICQGGSVNLEAIPSGGTGNYSYSWTSSPAGFNSSEKEINVSPDVTTVYTVVVDDGNTTAMNSIEVSVFDSATVVIEGDQTICSGESTEVEAILDNVSGGTWSTTGTGTFDNATALSTTYNPGTEDINQGSVQLIFTSDDPAGPCQSTSDTFDLTIQSIEVDAGNDQSITTGIATVLTGEVSGGSGSYTYEWTPADKLVSPGEITTSTIELFETTDFTLKATDNESGCSDEDDIRVNVSGGNLFLTINSSADSVCKGDSVSLEAIATGGIPPYSYQWQSVPGGFNSNDKNVSIELTSSTKYLVEVTDNEGSTIMDSINITALELPIVNAGSDITICADENEVQVCADEIPDGEYLWISGADTLSGQCADLTPGNWVLVGQNVLGCEDSDSVSISQSVPLTVELFQDSSVVINGGTAPYDTSYTQANDSLIVTVTDVNGCTASDNIELVSTVVSPLQNLNIYPNPAQNTVYIDRPNNVKIHIKIIDQYGKVRIESRNADEISLSDLSSGMYYIHCTVSDGKETGFKAFPLLKTE